MRVRHAGTAVRCAAHRHAVLRLRRRRNAGFRSAISTHGFASVEELGMDNQNILLI